MLEIGLDIGKIRDIGCSAELSKDDLIKIKCEYIKSYFGEDHQVKKLNEEILELALALMNVKNRSTPENVLEAYGEAGDCKILCLQLDIEEDEFEEMFFRALGSFNLKSSWDYILSEKIKINKILDEKLERTINRIKNGYYITNF